MLRPAIALGILALAACSPPVPESGAAPGYFDSYRDYNDYRLRRDEQLYGGRSPAPVTTPTTVRPPGQTPVAAAIPPGRLGGPSPAPVTTAAAEDGDDTARSEVAIDLDNPSISDEQDFAAVSNRQSIESDAERLRAQREAYQVIQPTALPTRSGSEAPNIVEYAISTRNAVGQKIYRRNTIFAGDKYVKNCARYASSDLAQEDFLRSGGPERDKQGLDPDGDGFACSWDPTPFRRIARQG